MTKIKYTGVFYQLLTLRMIIECKRFDMDEYEYQYIKYQLYHSYWQGCLAWNIQKM